MLASLGFDACVGEQPLQFARSRSIEAELAPRTDHGGNRTRPNGQLQVQQQVESTVAECPTQFAQSAEAGALVDGDKLDLGQQSHQAGLRLADDPAEAGLGPRALQSAQQRHHVAGIADGGQSQQAHGIRWRGQRQHGGIRYRVDDDHPTRVRRLGDAI